jgi:Chaperone of endosialidase
VNPKVNAAGNSMKGTGNSNGILGLIALLVWMVYTLPACAQSLAFERVVAQKPTTSDSNFLVSVDGNDSNDGLSWGTAKQTLAGALSAISNTSGTQGAHITLGCGTFSYNTTPRITVNGTSVAGSGWGNSNHSDGCTILNPAAGVTGLDIQANEVTVQNLRIHSSSTNPGRDYGIHAHANSNYLTLRNITVESTGSHGIYMDDSRSGNVNYWRMDNVQVLLARGDCFKFGGGGDNDNASLGTNLAGTGCTGWGRNIIDGSANTFINASVVGNIAGGTQWGSSIGNRDFNPYTESGTGSTYTFTSSATNNEVWFPEFGQPSTITDTVTLGNLIHYTDSGANGPLPVQNQLNIAPDPGASSAKIYSWQSGSYSAGYLSLANLTDSVSLLYCESGSSGCAFLVPLTSTRVNATSGYSANGTPGVSKGPYTAISSITTTDGIVTALSGASDERLKSGIDYAGGLAEILNIHPKLFHYNSLGVKQTGIPAERENIGFYAQDVCAVIPAACPTTEPSRTEGDIGPDGKPTQYLDFDPKPVTAALVNAVKEQQKEIEELKAEIEELKSKQ